MTFTLKTETLQKIAFAMEDQRDTFVLEAKTGLLKNAQDFVADETLYYALPQWDAKHGFDLMQSFVEDLHNAKAKNDLKTVLLLGSGVFKAFKEAIKKYPQVLKVWNEYKQKHLYQEIKNWYGTLCEVWGIENLGCDEVYEDITCDLVLDDFDFCDFVSQKDKNLCKSYDMAECLKNTVSPQVKQAFCFLLERVSCFSLESKIGIKAQTPKGDVAGFITIAQCDKENQVYCITDFYVKKQWRGLGLFSVLLEKCISLAKKKNIKWLVILAFPCYLASVFQRQGFQKGLLGYFIQLDKDNP